MKLITELTQDLEYLTEAKEDGSKNHYIHGVFMQAETKNRNGRIYPMNVLQNAVDNYIDTHVKQNRAMGELGHPNGPQLNLDRVSHMITQLKPDGNNYIGKARLADTPMGNIAKGLLNTGVRLGVSSRGMGSLEPGEGGVMVVQPDFRLATAADIVADPSAPNAFVNGVMENVNWVYDASSDSWYQEKLHEAKKQMRRMTMDEIEQNKLGIFESFINRLSSKKNVI
jgi:hypothetical protein